MAVRPSPDHAQISYSDLFLIRGRAAPSLTGGAGLEIEMDAAAARRRAGFGSGVRGPLASNASTASTNDAMSAFGSTSRTPILVASHLSSSEKWTVCMTIGTAGRSLTLSRHAALPITPAVRAPGAAIE